MGERWNEVAVTQAEIRAEQETIDRLYGVLDGLRAIASERYTAAVRFTGGTHQARTEREIAGEVWARRVTRLDAAERGLCFGRLDFLPGQGPAQPRYIGRINLAAPDPEDDPLLVDWRAPAARPFYVATALSPAGVRRRRQVHTLGRRVTGVDDEVLDLADPGAAGDHGHDGLTSEAALMAKLAAARTGRMTDVVETIQAEQDRIIRADDHGILVVQGGPGTGKTAVALHRAAYLMYEHRARLTVTGVLIVGPNPDFLRYIEDVLPSLGESGAVLTTLEELYPGVQVTRRESDAVAAVKGLAAMTEVVAQAVADRQRIPVEPWEIVTVDGSMLMLDPDVAELARISARETHSPHNVARRVFVDAIVEALAWQWRERIGSDPLGGQNLLDEWEVGDLTVDLANDPGVTAALDLLWPDLSPQQLLDDLFEDRDLIDSAAADLSPTQRDLLYREAGQGWSVADLPLLDEAAELLGEDRLMAQLREALERRRREEYAQGVLDISEGSRDIEFEDEESEVLAAFDLIDAGELAVRQEQGSGLTLSERASADREWAYGHVLVDEAQELSPMAMRMLLRRCPSHSMTLVGDVDQTGAGAGAGSWDALLSPWVEDRWRVEQLTVNYRTPREVMEIAERVLAVIDPQATPPESVREAGLAPRAVVVPPGSVGEAVADVVRRELAEVGDGHIGVIAPGALVDQVAAALKKDTPELLGGAGDLRRPVVVLTVPEAKGLEFDSVVLVAPAEIVSASPRGLSDLYVALTRTTSRLVLIPDQHLPELLGLG